MLLLDTALRGALRALLGVLIVALRRDRAQWRGASLGVALGLGLCVQVLSSAPWFEAGVARVWQAPAVAVSVANGLLFWLFVRALFDDRFALRPWHGGVWLAVAALGAANCAWLAGSAWSLANTAVAVQRMLPLVFATLALWAALRPGKSDDAGTEAGIQRRSRVTRPA